MIVSPDAKLEGEYYDAELGMFLDVAAELQSYPLWWKENPRAYALLLARREEEGIEVEDDLDIGPDDLDGLLGNDEILKAFEEDDD